MPRTTFIVCSGICLWLTTALFGQVPPPKHPSHQQVVGYTLQQQRAWHHRQLPANSVLLKSNSNYPASHAFLQNRNLMDLPVYEIPYGFSIKQPYALYPTPKAVMAEDMSFSFLQLYLDKERARYTNQLQHKRWADPMDPWASLLLRDLIIPPPQKVFQRK